LSQYGPTLLFDTILCHFLFITTAVLTDLSQLLCRLNCFNGRGRCRPIGL
jgi:hypothetical protein